MHKLIDNEIAGVLWCRLFSISLIVLTNYINEVQTCDLSNTLESGTMQRSTCILEFHADSPMDVRNKPLQDGRWCWRR